MKLEEHSLTELSEIQTRYFVGSSQRFDYLRIMVVRFSGTYRHGCSGNTDAVFMCAMTEAGNTAFEPHGIIYDLSELSYQWGDALGDLFNIGPRNNLGDHPVAVVVGPNSEKSVHTLCVGLDSDRPLESIGFVFRDLHAAWQYVETRIIKDQVLQALDQAKG